MDMRRVGGGMIVYVILLCVLATAGSSEANRWMAGTFFSNGASLDKDMAEQVWINCRQELMDMKEDFDLYFTQEATSGLNEINSKAAFLTKRNIHRVISVLSPQGKKTLFACLRKKNLPFSVFNEEDGSKNWFIKCYLNSLFGWPNAPRRYLVGKSRQHIKASPAPSYGLAPSVSAPASSPSPNLQPPVEAPEQPSRLPPVEAPERPSRLPVEAPERPSQLPDITDSPNPNVGPNLPSKKHDNNWKKHVVIVATTAVGTFFLVALLLFCCLNGSNKIGPRDEQKDDRPLLTLSFSDFSTGSSQKSPSVGNSSNKEFGINSGKTLSFVSSLSIVSDSHDSSVGEAPSSEASAGTSGNLHAPTPFPPLKPPPGRAAPPPPGPPPTPPPAPVKPAPRPPPPPKGARPPPAPPKSMFGNLKAVQPSPHASSEGDDLNSDSEAPKAKLKPFFWDKVRASPDQSMVWHEISAGSFQFNEEMIESLFGYSTVDKIARKKELSLEDLPQYIQIIDSKKAQNLSILLRALNVTTEEVCDALREGNELPTELLQTLLKMAPTTEEELKLRLFSGDPSQLGPAERFLKVLVEIPFVFKRLESLLFMKSLQEEVSNVKESFATLEVACNKLRNSRLFLKLLEAVLKTGNRMNDGTFRGGAQAFKLDTLLKLADVKGTNGKITLLHFVVQEIIRFEGIRAARAAIDSQSISSIKSEDFTEDTHETEENYRNLGLQVVSGLSNELEDVKRAAIIDADGLMATVSKLGRSLTKAIDFLNSEMKSLDEDGEFYGTLTSFVEHAEVDITWILEEEKRIMALVKSTADYFHGNAGKDEGLRLFAIVRDFLIMLDKVCKEVKHSGTNPIRIPRKEAPTVSDSPEARQSQLSVIHQRLFPVIMDRRMDSSSSDDESTSP